jgi:hypothetical protein
VHHHHHHISGTPQPIINNQPQVNINIITIQYNNSSGGPGENVKQEAIKNVSSPKTYEELQIALQRGYSGLASAVTGMTDQHVQPSPNPIQRPSSADTNQTSGSGLAKMSKMQDQQHADSAYGSHSSSQVPDKLRSKQMPSKAQTASSSSSSSSSRISQRAASQKLVSCVNLPASFLS